MSTKSGYVGMYIKTTGQTSIQYEIIPRIISRFIVISNSIICFTSFIIFFIREKINPINKAILISGGIYSTLGIFINVLGQRAWPIVFLPISLGASYIYKTKFKKYIKFFYLFLIILFVFIPINRSFYRGAIIFQTREAYQAENFMIDHYNWENDDIILAYFRVGKYLGARLVRYVESEFSYIFPRINEYDSIFYTMGLDKSLLMYNYTKERILQEEKFSSVYNNGFSYLMIRP